MKIDFVFTVFYVFSLFLSFSLYYSLYIVLFYANENTISIFTMPKWNTNITCEKMGVKLQHKKCM